MALAADDQDPVLPHYHHWLAAREDWISSLNLPDNEDSDRPETRAAEEREDDAVRAMTSVKATSMAGIAALAHVLWDFQAPGELNENTASEVILAIWHSTSGQDGTPPDCMVEAAA
ncbi:MAG: hypothetical protein AAF501_06245 [Pseudomonadota bacterium]